MMHGVLRSRFLCSLLLTLFAGANAAQSAEFECNYVKTLGQVNPSGAPLKGAGFRQLAVDPQGNICLTVCWAYPWTSIVKLGPNGRVIWESHCGGYTQVPLLVADDYVYAISPGFVLRRYALTTGKMDDSWGHAWSAQQNESKGVRRFESASGIAVSGSYLFVADKTAKTVRRLDRLSAAEKPFAAPLKMDEPLDLAVAKSGNLLVLTSTAVLEFDVEGKPVHAPLIDKLSGAQALKVDAFTGEIFVAVGGMPGKLVNQIWQYGADGKPTGAKLGRGGDFNGPWSPDNFAFSTGEADFSLDASGGIWVNTGLGQLVHFTSAPAFRHDQTFLAIPDMASDIAADGDLNLYVTLGQGAMKIGWDNEVKWTCGIRPSGDAQRYPGSPIYGWPIYVAHAGGKNPVFYGLHANMIYTLSTESGHLVGQVAKSDFHTLARVSASGDRLQAAGGEKDFWTVRQSPLDKPGTWTPLLSPPTPWKAAFLGRSPDAERTYWSDGKHAICLDARGKGIWAAESPSIAGRYVHPVAFLGNDVIFLPGEDSYLSARNARTGALLGIVGEKEVRGRPAINSIRGLALATKNGDHYLFVLSNHQVQVFEVTFKP